MSTSRMGADGTAMGDEEGEPEEGARSTPTSDAPSGPSIVSVFSFIRRFKEKKSYSVRFFFLSVTLFAIRATGDYLVYRNGKVIDRSC